MKINNQVISLFNPNFFIKEDDIVFLVFEICSKLNYKKLIDSYAKEGRPSALPINVMFMVVVYAYIIPMTFINEKHRLNFDEALSRLNQLDRNNYALMSAIYLLTADLRLWFQSKRFVENHGISFGKLRPKNCSEESYPLYCAAKDLYLGTKHITINDLADNKLINAKTFALICNAMAIRKFGLGAVRYTNET